MEKSGISCRICNCSGHGIELEWDRPSLTEVESHDPLNVAIATEKGPVRTALLLVRENLLSAENCLWVGRATVKDMGTDSQGCVVITDLKIWVGYFNAEVSNAYANGIERSAALSVQRLKGMGQDGMFRVEGLPVQSIVMTIPELLDMERVLAETSPLGEEINESSATTTSSAVEAMQELQALLDGGLITETEFQTKRQEIIDRL